MSQAFDYLVIGGGCIGVSIAWHLAKRNAGSIALLEREKFLGTESTGKCAGGVRAQFSTEVNTQLSLYSLSAFERFEEELGHPLQFFQWGYLFLLFGDEQEAAFRKSREMWQRNGMDVEWLEPAAITERFPYVNMEGVTAATLHMRDGFVDPNDITQGYAKAARELGSTELTEHEVTGLVRDPSGKRIVGVETKQGTIGVNKGVVFATGAWTKQLGAMVDVEIPIEPYRRQILVTKKFDAIPTPFPMTVDMNSGLYFHPESGGVLIGLADKNEPPSFNQALNEDFSDEMLMTALERCPALEEAAILRGWAGLYETTPDHHPIIDRVGELENAWLCAGFSGHGLMHAPAAGLVSAELILDGKASSIDISRLRLNRFDDPSALMDEANVI
ncbi:MAG: FAD-binding oxidoreductase [Planctomycetes bacterium]|nr:FAD-binding oxidoreductase [Planctomycetota bacterium]